AAALKQHDAEQRVTRQAEAAIKAVHRELDRADQELLRLRNEIRDVLQRDLEMLRVIQNLLDNHRGGGLNPANPADRPALDANAHSVPPGTPPGAAPNNTLIVPPPASGSYPPDVQGILGAHAQAGGGVVRIPVPGRRPQDVGDTLATALDV